MTMTLSRWKLSRRVLAGLLLVTATACASKQAPKPVTAHPDAAEQLVAQMTEWLKLDAAQQEKTRQLARELIARNEKIHENWERTKKPHAEELLASRGQFQMELFAILTPEQRKRFTDTATRIQAQGRTVPKSPP